MGGVMTASQRLFRALKSYRKAKSLHKKRSGIWRELRDARTACLLSNLGRGAAP